MRVRGDVQPNNAFTVDEMPDRPGYCLVRFFANAQPFEEMTEGLTIRGWCYDEYHLELADSDTLSDDILANFDALLAEAKYRELSRRTVPQLAGEIIQLTEEKADLARQLTDLQLALCEVYEKLMEG